jgi:protein-disulfide isomerase
MSGAEEQKTSRGGAALNVTRFYALVAVVVVIGVGVVAYNATAGTSRRPASGPVEVAGLDDPETLVEMARGVTKGNPDAPVTIVEFGDYQCPGCGQFARDFKPDVQLTLVETGRAKFVFHDYPLVAVHPSAFLAARAARCAEDQGLFWEYHDELFRQQARWSTQVDPADSFEDYAAAVGLDAGEFDACLASDRHADLVTANLRLAEALGILSTPTILVNAGGQTREAAGWDAAAIARSIDELTAVDPQN